MIEAVVFDLDDTLFPEIDYVKSGFRVVGKEIEKRFAIKDAYKSLLSSFSADKNDVYVRVLCDYGVAFTESDIADFVEIYRTHQPKLTLTHDVSYTLSLLRQKGLKLGIITDGRPFQQHAKIKSLRLDKLFDSIICTDELGGIKYRKPNPFAFLETCRILNIKPEAMVYVGDNPKKDFAIKNYLPIHTIRFLSSGLYSCEKYLDDVMPDKVIDRFSDVLNAIGELK